MNDAKCIWGNSSWNLRLLETDHENGIWLGRIFSKYQAEHRRAGREGGTQENIRLPLLDIWLSCVLPILPWDGDDESVMMYLRKWSVMLSLRVNLSDMTSFCSG